MTLKEGCKLAEAHFSQIGEKGIRQILETSTLWIVLPGIYGQVQYGGSAITVDKESGQISPFHLPSKEGFALLKSAKEIPVPEEYILVEEEKEDGIR